MSINLRGIDYAGLAAVIFASSLGIALIVGVAGLSFRGRVLGEAGSEVLIAVGSAMTGAVSTYLGMRRNGDSKPPLE
jgi:hypothetical protein